MTPGYERMLSVCRAFENISHLLKYVEVPSSFQVISSSSSVSHVYANMLERAVSISRACLQDRQQACVSINEIESGCLPVEEIGEIEVEAEQVYTPTPSRS